MSNGNLEIRAISAHRGGTPGGGEYKQSDGTTRIGASRDYDVCKLIDTTTCIGCKACEVACVEWNGYEFRETTFDNTYQTMPETAWNFWNLIKFNEDVDSAGNVQWLMRKDQCMHCEEPGCLIACPADGAIVQYTNGIVDFNQANCIGCQYCVSGCPFNIPKFNEATKKVYKCTLCSDRVGAGLEPACIKSCPTGCLHFGSKEDMKVEAIKRVAQLHANGHGDAGIYNPGDPDQSATSPGSIGGTHVIYVLNDAKNPERYGGLPASPSVPLFVKLWKGPLKWIGGIGMAAGVLGVFMHYIRFGPKEVDKAEEVKR
ncbi:MAG TPA: formate dehydrogenase subunit beta [Candidatus Angelobacter sp.]|jgi:formate dehydrogenase beta subunit